MIKRDLRVVTAYATGVSKVLAPQPLPGLKTPAKALHAQEAHLQDIAGQAPQPRLHLSQLHFQKWTAQGVSQQQTGVPSPDHHIQALLLQQQQKV